MLIVVRHGRTAHNAARRLLGRLDVPLDDVGRRQAEALGRSARLAAVRRVVCSPLVRARETAEALGHPVEIDERWSEIDYGVLDGLPLGEVPDEVWSAGPDWAPEGGESVASVGRRVRTACEELWPDAIDRDVAVVTHVSPIRAALKWGMGLPDDAEVRLFVATASVSRIGPGRRGPAVHSFNETDLRPDG